MNWITRCPECATVYQVVPEQLRMAKGWLRCGHCAHVFDSTGRVLAWQGASQGGDTPRDLSESIAHSEPVLSSESLPQPALKQDFAAVLRVVPDPFPSAEFESVGEQSEASQTSQERLFSPLMVSEQDELPRHPEPVRRGPWTFLSLALMLSLLSQWLWLQRDVLSVQFPLTAPIYRSVCEVAGCESLVLRNPDGMVIDSSSFVRRSDGFVLRWTVRNSSAQTLGMTALELTLKDVQDKDLVRRVLLPQDMGAPSVWGAGQTWSGDLMLSVAADFPVVGYRVLSFYP